MQVKMTSTLVRSSPPLPSHTVPDPRVSNVRNIQLALTCAKPNHVIVSVYVINLYVKKFRVTAQFTIFQNIPNTAL